MAIGPKELEEMLLQKEAPLGTEVENEIDLNLEDRFNKGVAVFATPKGYEALGKDYRQLLLNKYRNLGWQVTEIYNQREERYFQFQPFDKKKAGAVGR
ncbi:MAG: hypothetical protein WC254_06510 [Candidatus Woesearchaeota archaeon]